MARSRLVRLAGVLWLLALTMLVVDATAAPACSCAQSGGGAAGRTSADETEFRNATEVLIVVPIERIEREGEAIGNFRPTVVLYQLEVREAIKGRVPASIEVVVGSLGSSCATRELPLGREVGIIPYAYEGRRSLPTCHAGWWEPGVLRQMAMDFRTPPGEVLPPGTPDPIAPPVPIVGTPTILLGLGVGAMLVVGLAAAVRRARRRARKREPSRPADVTGVGTGR